MASLPRALSAVELQRLLASCERGTAVGRRNWAILLLLARLGLRAGEVTALTLDDIDWAAAELCIQGAGVSANRLPLPHEVGAALADYLRDGRPACTSRRCLFACARPLVASRVHRPFPPSCGVRSRAPDWILPTMGPTCCGTR